MKKILVTGANRGIGLAFCKEYLAQGWHVIAACRTASAALAQSGAHIIDGIDVTDATAIAHLTKQMENTCLDVLINNAGILQHDNLSDLNDANIIEQFRVNAEAPLRIAQALLNNLNHGSKIAFITSRMGSIADNTSGGYYGYRMSKAALNAAAVSLSHDVKSRGIAVGILHPGYVQTAMVNFNGDITAEESAKRLSQRIAELNLNNSGGFWHANGDRLPW